MSEIAADEFIRQKFAEYYREHSQSIQPPASIDRREFGFLLFKERIMVRHKGFKEAKEMGRFIESVAPSDAYYSAAYYERPEEEMERKGWIGADLFFDIDADHLKTPCRTEHEYWICENCRTTGRGKRPAQCPDCGGERLTEEAWPCETCLEAAKAEALKLVDFLLSDFGFKERDMGVYFSGHRGYHVHVGGGEAIQLDQTARREIIDYVQGVGMKPQFHGFFRRRKLAETMRPALDDPGWRGRLARGIYDFWVTKQAESSEETKEMEEFWEAAVKWGPQTFKDALKSAVERHAVTIDTVVTADIHRLMRLPETLHGKTGLRVVRIPIERLSSFDPLREAVAFKEGTLVVKVEEAYRFRLGDATFGPYRRERVELPTAAAMLLLCKRVASPSS